MSDTHSFHIPVMGIAYTIDTPLKVAHLGINSVISLVDDNLLEKLRKLYFSQYDIPYIPISSDDKDHRAKRITAYLNMLNDLVENKFEDFKKQLQSKKENLKHYMSFLPDTESLRKEYLNWTKVELKKWIKDNVTVGRIDVNIMTKLDKENLHENKVLPQEFNDAHAAIRGFAKSKISSSVVLSAGMNPSLYSYIECFDDFYPDLNGTIRKKITLKVSDYRSAAIQGKFLAKKGLWVSEFRIESGLNCGGHAFSTNGNLMGPILSEFRENRDDLINGAFDIYCQALMEKDKQVPDNAPELKISAQGGVGTSDEHQFLLEQYDLDSVGWGSPFLLVPEATTVDNDTLQKLAACKEDDIYLSSISPLGVPFNNLRGNTKDLEKNSQIEKGRPGSSCPKKYLELNKEFSEKGICTASRQYQHLKLEEIRGLNLGNQDRERKENEVMEKSCICVGLGTAALLVNNMDTSREGKGVSICPGPNMAYFSKVVSLQEMIHHIYGFKSVNSEIERPHMFIKELQINITQFENTLKDLEVESSPKSLKMARSFYKNLNDGIDYYFRLFLSGKENLDSNGLILEKLILCSSRVSELGSQLEK